MRGHLPDTSPSSGARARHLLPQGEGFSLLIFLNPQNVQQQEKVAMFLCKMDGEKIKQ